VIGAAALEIAGLDDVDLVDVLAVEVPPVVVEAAQQSGNLDPRG
jgi:hypothetical protein